MTAAVSVAEKAATAAKGAGSKAATAAKGAGGRAGTAKGAGARGSRAGAPALTKQQQVDGIQAIKDARPANAVTEAAGVTPSPEPSSTSSWSPSVPAPVAGAAGTGSGFLLGVAAWAVGLAYLQGGMPAVRKFLNAKFFNKV